MFPLIAHAIAEPFQLRRDARHVVALDLDLVVFRRAARAPFFFSDAASSASDAAVS